MIKKTTEQFIKDANLIHGNKFNYDLVEYKGVKNKIKIICPNNHIFEQSPNDHLNGHGCKKCSGWGEMKDNNEEFLERIRNTHSSKIICDKTQYVNHSEKVILKCPTHGFFKKTPKDLLIKKQGCPKCGYEQASLKNKSSQIDFINKANIIHNNFYDYSLVEYNNAITKVKILCPKHGVFKQNPKDHINQSHGCPLCASSKGEKIIESFLIRNQIDFIHQHSFKDCINPNTKRILFFDYYLPTINICIEYDGIQHYLPVNKFGGQKNLYDTIYRDNLKNEYCIKNNIQLLRIKYTKIKQIENILKKICQTL
jgi:ferredoxin-like protein FixX